MNAIHRALSSAAPVGGFVGWVCRAAEPGSGRRAGLGAALRFCAEGRCIALRHEIIEIAGTVDGPDVAQFTAADDSGVAKGLVIAEAREGWEHLEVSGSPTVVFPSGRQVSDLGLPRVRPVEGRVARLAPPPCSGQDCRDRLLGILTAELDA